MSAQDDLAQQAQAAQADVDSQSGAIASIAASVQTGAEVASEINHYAKYAPKGGIPTSVGAAKDWAASALTQYAKDNAKQWGHDAIQNVASAYGYEGFVPDQIPTNEKECAETAVSIASSAVAVETGVDPKLAKVTIEAVMDGKLDKEDCESIGKTAGSIAGAAVCQMFGIPAPIGALVGGALGSWVGGEVADIFGLSSKAYDAWLKEQQRIVNAELVASEEECMKIRDGYWRAFDAYVIKAEQQWEALEIGAGYKFDLRWFGKGRGPAFDQFMAQQPSRYPPGYVSAPQCQTMCQDGSVLHTGSAPYLSSLSTSVMLQLSALCRQRYIANPKMPTMARAALKFDPKLADPKLTDVCSRSCLVDSFGCLYPDLTPYVKYAPTGATLGSTKRVVAAYRALGFSWMPPLTPELLRSWGARDYTTMMAAIRAHGTEFRPNYCSLPEATQRAVKDTTYRQLWQDWLRRMLVLENQRVANLNSASVKLFGDLAQTAATCVVQAKLMEAKTIKALKGLGTADPVIDKSAWVNNGTLVGGLGILAWSLKGAR